MRLVGPLMTLSHVPREWAAGNHEIALSGGRDSLLTLLSAQGTVSGALGKTGWLLVGAFGSVAALNAWLATKFADGDARYVEATS